VGASRLRCGHDLSLARDNLSGHGRGPGQVLILFMELVRRRLGCISCRVHFWTIAAALGLVATEPCRGSAVEGGAAGFFKNLTVTFDGADERSLT